MTPPADGPPARAGDGPRERTRAQPRRAKLPPGSLPLHEQREAALGAALRLLGARERSATELRARLRGRGFDRRVVDDLLERLSATALQDDRRFAERFAADAAARGLAPRLVQRGLRARGVEKELAAGAAAASPGDEEGRARALAMRRAGGMRGLPPEVRSRRLLALLARRGYDADLGRRIAREVAGDGGEGAAGTWGEAP